MSSRHHMTALDGALERHADGWRWRDGTPEPLVRDMLASRHYGFRIRESRYVEVPIGLARENDDLAWVQLAADRGELEESWDGDVVGPDDRSLLGEVRPEKRAARVWLVPIATWDERNRQPIGAEWDREHEDAILRRAAELGWRDPR